MVLAVVPVTLGRSRYLAPVVPLMTSVVKVQIPFPLAEAVMEPPSDAPFNDPLSNSGSRDITHVPDAVDAH